LEVFLSQYCGDEDIVTPIYPHVEPHVSRNYQGLRNPIPELLDNKGDDLKALLRRVVRREKFYNHIPAKYVKDSIPENIWNSYFKFCVERNPWSKTLSYYHHMNALQGGNLTFEEYLNSENFCYNYPVYCDKNDEILVDRVIPYESLAENLDTIFKEMDIPFSGELTVKAKSEHKKDSRPYQEIFTLEQRELVEKAFYKEIQMHGYTFE